MTASFKIDQVGLAAGTADRGRRDGLATGAVVTLTHTGGVFTEASFRLLSVPSSDTTAIPSLARGSYQPGAGVCTYSFTPTPGARGSYLIEELVDGQSKRLVLAVLTPNLGIEIPAWNAQADPTAHLAGADGAGAVASSDQNAPTARYASGDPRGDFPALEAALLAIDAASLGSSGLVVRKNSGADVGTRPRLNVIEGSHVALTVADDAGDGEIDLTVAWTGTTARLNSGADVGTRPRFNFIEGANVSIALNNDAGDNEIEVTIAAAAATTIRKNSGADVGTRPRINLIEGANVTLTVTDDGVSDEIDITIAAAGGGTPSLDTVVNAGGDNDVDFTGDIILNNTGAGGFKIKDGGGDVIVVSGAGAVSVTPTSGQSMGFVTAGVGYIQFTSANGMYLDVSAGSIYLRGFGAAELLTVAATGAVSITPTSGTSLSGTVAGAGTIVLNTTGTGKVAIQDGGGDVIAVSGSGAVDITPTSNQNFGVTVTGTGSISINNSGSIGAIDLGAANGKIISIGNTSNTTNLTLYGASGAVRCRVTAAAEGTVDRAACLTLEASSLISAAPQILLLETDPNGQVSSPPKGSLGIDVATPAVWQKDADSPSTAWTQLGGAGGVGLMTSVKLSSARSLPNGTETWFTVSGVVLIHGIYMQVVTTLSATATAVEFKGDGPGTSAVTFHSSTVNMSGWAAGRGFSIRGDATNTDDSASVGAMRVFESPMVGVDTMTITLTNNSQPTGTVNAWVIYTPLESGAEITAGY